MSEQKKHSVESEDDQVARDILEHRKFSLEEAIGRMAGANLMKGASPVTLRRQAELILEQFVQQHFTDSEGALSRVLVRRVRDSEALLNTGYERPLAVLADEVAALLESQSRLEQFVNAVDTEWGRMYRERPHFERGGQPADAGDPYTFAGVRSKLEGLRSELARGQS